MNLSPLSSRGRFIRSVRPAVKSQISALDFQNSEGLSKPFSRRRFMGVAAGAAGGVLLSSSFLSNSKAATPVAPQPIPGGLQFLFPAPTVFHVEAPGYPGSGLDPATNDPSVITDFNGYVGLAYLTGMGTHTNRTTGHISRLPFEVDLHFMKRTYVGTDGHRYDGTFRFI
jgi:hypothetical protein